VILLTGGICSGNWIEPRKQTTITKFIQVVVSGLCEFDAFTLPGKKRNAKEYEIMVSSSRLFARKGKKNEEEAASLHNGLR
jgi:hypothetical protein